MSSMPGSRTVVAFGCDAAVAKGQDAGAGGSDRGRMGVGRMLLVLGLLLNVGDSDPVVVSLTLSAM